MSVAAIVRSGALVVAAAATLVVASGCAWTHSQPTTVSRVDDATITATVKARLAEDATLDPAALVVQTANGNVTLSGVATDTLARQTAEGIAIKVRGVKGVQNNIAVKP